MTARKAAKRLAELAELYGSHSKGNGDPALFLSQELASLLDAAYFDAGAKSYKAYEKMRSLLKVLARMP